VPKVRFQFCLIDQEGAIVREGDLATEEVTILVCHPGLPLALEAPGPWGAAYNALAAQGAQVWPAQLVTAISLWCSDGARKWPWWPLPECC